MEIGLSHSHGSVEIPNQVDAIFSIQNNSMNNDLKSEIRFIEQTISEFHFKQTVKWDKDKTEPVKDYVYLL
jgi:L-ribulose-5-phosphate 3-epimerase UlaE